jgi:hypothetical protein
VTLCRIDVAEVQSGFRGVVEHRREEYQVLRVPHHGERFLEEHPGPQPVAGHVEGVRLPCQGGCDELRVPSAAGRLDRLLAPRQRGADVALQVRKERQRGKRARRERFVVLTSSFQRLA